MEKRYIQYFLDMMAAEKGAGNNTIVAYKHDILQFFEITETKLENITEQHILYYIDKLANLYYTNKSQARKLSALKEFCKFLTEEKILKSNPTANITLPKLGKPLPNFLTKEQIKLLTAEALNQKSVSLKVTGFMIDLMFSTGLRVSEIVSLPENAINHDKKIVTVLGKGNKERIVPISDSACKNILEYYTKYRRYFIKKDKISSYMFPSKKSLSGYITRQTFFKNLKTVAFLAELNPEIISPHTLRHSFATNLINHEADLRSVQKMLGHENIVTTEIYTHILDEKLVDTVYVKHPLANFKFK